MQCRAVGRLKYKTTQHRDYLVRHSPAPVRQSRVPSSVRRKSIRTSSTKSDCDRRTAARNLGGRVSRARGHRHCEDCNTRLASGVWVTLRSRGVISAPSSKFATISIRLEARVSALWTLLPTRSGFPTRGREGLQEFPFPCSGRGTTRENRGIYSRLRIDVPQNLTTWRNGNRNQYCRPPRFSGRICMFFLFFASKSGLTTISSKPLS